MLYKGNKNRLLKHIIPLLLVGKEATGSDTLYDPFMGGGSVSMHAPFRYKFASDFDPTIIAFYNKLIQDGIDWLPDKIPEHLKYNFMDIEKSDPALFFYLTNFFSFKQNRKIDSHLYTEVVDQYGNVVNTVDRVRRNISIELPLLRGITDISCKSYDMVDYSDNSVVYMDPPYRNTSDYYINKITGGFDHDAFWDFVRDLSKRCFVVVSEYSAPCDFDPVVSIKRTCTMQNSDGQDVSDNIYMFTGCDFYNKYIELTEEVWDLV